MATGATGKRKLILDASSVDLSQERDERWWAFPPNTSLDLFRYSSYNLWGLLRKGPKVNSNYLHHLKSHGSAPYKIQFGKPSIDESSILPLVVQEITLKTDRTKFNGSGWPGWWTKYIKGGTFTGKKNRKINNGEVLPGIIQEDVEFTDHTFELLSPYEEEELGTYASLGKPVQINIDPVYNFFNEEYEAVSSEATVPEALLPNMYIFTSYGDNREKEEVNPAYADFITLGRHLPRSVLKLRGAEIRNQYYDIWASKATSLSPDMTSWLQNKGSNSALPLAEAKKFNHYSELRSEFPMYVDISFSTDTKTKFADMLEASKLDVAFLSDVMKETIPDIANEMVPFQMIEMRDNPALVQTDQGGSAIRNNPTVTAETRKALDITDWLTKFIDFNEESMEMELVESTAGVYAALRDRVDKFATFLGSTLDNDLIVTDPKYEPFKRLMIMIFSGKLRRLVKENFRTFEEMLVGKLAYSETVLYRIAKTDINGVLIQNIYIPNSSDIDVFRFIDTQVKYDKDYIYSIYAYQAVIGTKYEYLDAFAGWRDQEEMGIPRGQRNTTAKLTVAYQPSIKLFEIPFHSTRRIVLDVPPLIPDVEFIPYRGKEDRIQIRLNGMLGRYEAAPIIIESEDSRHINRLQQYTLRLKEDDPIPFFRGRGDELDFASHFQVFRTKEKPKSYLDLRGRRHTLVSTDVTAQTPQEANSAEMIDFVEPNQKYYYLFRAVDKHGHISNPTAIYEVEMVEENGSVYSTITAVEFAQSPRASTKSMKRYLHIKPNVENSLIDRQALGERVEGKDIERVNLGFGDERVWGKKFKIRLTSKNSGKKIDFNLNFATRHIKPGDR